MRLLAVAVSGMPVAATYYLADDLRTTQMELSEGGWPVWEGQFSPFGQELPDGSTTMRYKFTGLETDSETALSHADFRQLASIEGRWTSPDPYDGSMDFSNPQTLSRYRRKRIAVCVERVVGTGAVRISDVVGGSRAC